MSGLKKKIKIPLMLVPYELSLKLSRPIIGVGTAISKIYPGFEYDLRESDIEETPGKYVAASLITSFLMFIIFFSLMLFLNLNKAKPWPYSLGIACAYGFAMFFMFLVILMKYPSILARKKAELIDKNLIFALKDLLLNVSSGVSLYNAMVNVAKSNYGEVSKEFEEAVRSINTGTSMEKALEHMASSSKSEYLRKTMWQLVNTMKAGASVKGALKNIIDELTIDQRGKIRNYSQELNLWSLLYMMFAVAIPTIGATMLVILSSFAGFEITPITFISFIVITVLVQLALIGLIKSRRPIVQF